MSDILQITTPITPRDYQQTNRHDHQSQQTDTNQVFNLGDQTKIVKTNERAEDYAEQDLKDQGLISMPRKTAGMDSPTATLDTVKELLSAETFSALREKGDEALMNKISAFAEEVVLKPENLLRDMINQQENATIFSGKMWDALRMLAKTDSPDMKSAVMDFVKAAAETESKDELLGSLSANFKFLAEELAPSKAVSEELMKASEALSGPDAARNFTAIKSTLVQLVNYTNSSLLLDNKTQNLLPLVIHNISRYSSDPTSLRSSFETLLNIFDNIDLTDKQLETLADTLGVTPGMKAEVPEKAAVSDFPDLPEELFYTEGESPHPDEPSMNIAAGTDTAANISENANAESPDISNANAADKPAADTGSANTHTDTAAPSEAAASAANAASSEAPKSAPAPSRGFFSSLFSTEAPKAEEQPAVSQQEIRTELEKLFDDYVIAGRLSQDVKRSSIINSDTLREQSRLEDMTKLLTIGVSSMAKRLDSARLKDTLSGIDPRRGSASVKLALASVTPNTPAMAEALDSIVSNYDKTGDLQSLIERLGNIINSIDDMDKKLPLAQSLNESLGHLAEKTDSNYRPPTSIDILSDFLLKNIDDPSLRSVTALNKSDMIQTMLTSPGVFNPLMHFFVPLDAFGMRSFAELWVDRNADRGSRDIADGDGETSHVFMCFDMEDVGYFEMEMFAKGTTLSVMLLCPEGKEAAFEKLKESVPRIAAGAGYTVGTTIVDTLYKKRNLDRIFPRLRTTGGEFHANA